MKKIMLVMLLAQSGYAASPMTASFNITAAIENGCSLSNAEQVLDFGHHPVTSSDKVQSFILNTAQSWNIRCTQDLPVSVMLGGGNNAENNIRRMKHESQSNFVPYRLYQNSDLKNEYVIGGYYQLTPTTTSNPILNFSIYGVADLNTTQPKSAGLYKDRVAITISW